MDYFPLFANLRDQPCLIVGGGGVAARKAAELLRAGARLTVNAPDCCAEIRARAMAGELEWRQGPFQPGLLAGYLLVIAATSDPAVNREIAAAARSERRLCNVVDDAVASTFIVPAIVDRSPVIVAVSSGGRAPVLSRLLRQRLEQWLPHRLGPLAEWAGSWRERVRIHLPGSGARRAFWERLLAGPAAAAALRGDVRSAEELAGALLETPGENPGKAWLVGAGPGDPGLISLRGLRVLEQADVVVHDRLVAPALLRAARREAEVICVGKAGGAPSTSQDEINRLLVARVRAGSRVCRLKGGDPLVFGRGGEEALALAEAGLPFEIVPGITAASGCGAAAGIPLTHRGLATAVTLVTAQTSGESAGPDWASLAAAGHTLVIYMGGAHLGDIAAGLIGHGRAPGTAAALITRGTTAEEQVVTGTLADIAARATAVRGISPALLIVGETVALAGRLSASTTRAVHTDEPLPGPMPPPAAFFG